MTRDEIAAAHQRMVEQVSSDERLLGLLPEDLSRMLLDWAVRRLDGAKERAASVDDYYAEADAIRAEAMRIASAGAKEADDATALVARLSRAEAPAVPRTGAGDEGTMAAAPTAAGLVKSETRPPVDASLTAALRRTLARLGAMFRGGSR
jgi:hypothetical protein